MKLFRFFLVGTLCAAFSLHVQAQTISVNFAEDDGGQARANQTLLPGDLAGANGYEAVNWNNALFSTSSMSDLIDNSGSTTSASVSWTANNGWGDGTANSDANAGLPNAKLQRGYVDDTGAGNTATINVTNIPYAIYDLVLYFSSDGFGELHGSFQVNGQAFGNLGQIIGWQTEPTLEIGRNVLVLNGLTSDSLEIIGTREFGVSRGSISGLQIVQVPEPGSALLGVLAVGALVVRRRR